jgi:hypothetical protein
LTEDVQRFSLFHYLRISNNSCGTRHIHKTLAITNKKTKMNIEEIKLNIVGKWQYEDGRILTFSTGEDFTLTTKDRTFTSPSQRIFFKRQENGTITLSMPQNFEQIGIIKLVDKDRIVYDSVNIDGTKHEMMLTRM